MLTLTHNGLTASPAGPATIPLLTELAGHLHRQAVHYCHWKGGFNLQRVLTGEGDLDLLVHRKDAAKFEGILGQLGFKRAVDPLRPHTPSVCHFYGFDPATDSLIHLHVYYRLVTGESLLDNYVLPLESFLLGNTKIVEGMHVAEPRAALTAFVCRLMLAYASVPELLLRRRDEARLRATLEGLLAQAHSAPSTTQLAEWLPCVQPALFFECLNALRNGSPLLRRFWLGRRLRRQLDGFRRLSLVSEAALLCRLFLLEGVARLIHGRRSRKQLVSGGAVIAFVGPDASGKSTLVRETCEWLGTVFRISSAHLGKPPATWFSLGPNLARRLLRSAFPRLRASNPGADHAERPVAQPGLLHRVRDVLAAWDRLALANRLRRKAANGQLVVCDRYPSATVGALDGAVNALPNGSAGRFSLHDGLARLENWLYRRVPPPDVLVRVVAPLPVALERNRLRRNSTKSESDDYVRQVHSKAVLPVFPNAPTFEINTDQPQPVTLQTLRRLLWEAL